MLYSNGATNACRVVGGRQVAPALDMHGICKQSATCTARAAVQVNGTAFQNRDVRCSIDGSTLGLGTAHSEGGIGILAGKTVTHDCATLQRRTRVESCRTPVLEFEIAPDTTTTLLRLATSAPTLTATSWRVRIPAPFSALQLCMCTELLDTVTPFFCVVRTTVFTCLAASGRQRGSNTKSNGPVNADATTVSRCRAVAHRQRRPSQDYL